MPSARTSVSELYSRESATSISLQFRSFFTVTGVPGQTPANRPALVQSRDEEEFENKATAEVVELVTSMLQTGFNFYFSAVFTYSSQSTFTPLIIFAVLLVFLRSGLCEHRAAAEWRP